MEAYQAAGCAEPAAFGDLSPAARRMWYLFVNERARRQQDMMDTIFGGNG